MAQTIGLVLAARAKLRGLPAPHWPDSSIYNFCNRVTFTGRTRPSAQPWRRDAPLPDPDAWLNSLPSGTTEARLRVIRRNDPNIGDRMSVAFAGGGPVSVAEILADIPEGWIGRWEVTDREAADRRIWSVNYRNAGRAPPDIPEVTATLVEARSALDSALREAADFAQAQGMGFESSIRAGLEALDSPDPMAGYFHADLFPEGLLSLEARQVFASAAKSWVFGGMGSWNDWGSSREEDQRRYEAISDRFFWAVIAGLVAGTNGGGS
ncbi:hypothetical protein IAI18_21955 [Acetobacteraceae bacterium H6797]|nr:hypothetical protein [Acetobacteraceae bacterium H6797]